MLLEVMPVCVISLCVCVCGMYDNFVREFHIEGCNGWSCVLQWDIEAEIMSGATRIQDCFLYVGGAYVRGWIVCAGL